MAQKHSLRQYLDRRLSEYYEANGRNDYVDSEGDGLFLNRIDEQCFDSDEVAEELNGEFEDCCFLDFDDHFPLSGSPRDCRRFLFDLLVGYFQEHPTECGNQHGAALNLDAIDLSVFEHSDSRCTRPTDGIPITECCSALNRLCRASLYFEAVRSCEVDEDTKRGLFVRFNADIYRSALDDTAHLSECHDDDIGRIHREWTERYGLPKCTVSHCAKTRRHYGRRRGVEQKEVGEEEAEYHFYEALYDRVHNFVAHLFDIGMRVDASSLTLGDGEEAESEGVSVDKLFAAERKAVRMRREQSNVVLDHLDDENNKFTIQIAAEKEGSTLRDAVIQKLAKTAEIQRETLRRIKAYFGDNGFDSDSIEMDVEDFADSNLSALIQSESVVQMMADYIHSVNCAFSLFVSVSLCSAPI